VSTGRWFVVFEFFGRSFVRSGKTTELLRRTRRYSIARRSCLVIKYAGDTRYAVEEAATHDGVKQTARSACRLAQVEDWMDFDVISIDEGQFFPDVVEFADEAAAAGKTVLVCGLDSDFMRRPFGRLLQLIPLAERVDKLTAVCAGCGADAAFTRRLTHDDAVEVIGGWEAYRPVCRSCFAAPQAELEALLEAAGMPCCVPTLAEAEAEAEAAAGAGADADVGGAPADIVVGDAPQTPPPASLRSKAHLQGSPTSSVGSAADPSSPMS
jgi:thymidine kinase